MNKEKEAKALREYFEYISQITSNDALDIERVRYCSNFMASAVEWDSNAMCNAIQLLLAGYYGPTTRVITDSRIYYDIKKSLDERKDLTEFYEYMGKTHDSERLHIYLSNYLARKPIPGYLLDNRWRSDQIKVLSELDEAMSELKDKYDINAFDYINPSMTADFINTTLMQMCQTGKVPNVADTDALWSNVVKPYLNNIPYAVRHYIQPCYADSVIIHFSTFKLVDELRQALSFLSSCQNLTRNLEWVLQKMEKTQVKDVDSARKILNAYSIISKRLTFDGDDLARMLCDKHNLPYPDVFITGSIEDKVKAVISLNSINTDAVQNIVRILPETLPSNPFEFEELVLKTIALMEY